MEAIGTDFAIVRSQECITQRHLLERAIANTKEALERQVDEAHVGAIEERCESISAFVVVLQRLLAGRQKLTLVFDGIDNQRDAAPTLLPAIARLGEVVSLLRLCSSPMMLSQLVTKSDHYPRRQVPPTPPTTQAGNTPHPLPSLHTRRDTVHPLPISTSDPRPSNTRV